MILPFVMETQIKALWCWAATAKSVSAFYLPKTKWTQCKIASAELVLKCCDNPFPENCDVVYYLNKALTRTANYVSYTTTLTWQEILTELSKGLVIGARVQWSDGGGHFVVIHGATSNIDEQYLNIDDPYSGKTLVTYNQFLTNYLGDGTWTHTFYTKK